MHLLGCLQRIVQSFHTTVASSTQDDIANLQRSVLYHDLRDHALVGSLTGFQTDTNRGTIWVGSVVVQLGDRQQRFKQFVHALASDSAGANHFDVAAPFAGGQPMLGHLSQYSVDVGARQIDLIQSYHDRHASGFSMADRFFGLRHDTVFRRDHQHCDVRHVGTACPHFSERFVARSIDKRDLLAVFFDLVSSNVLRDTPRFAGNDASTNQVVEQ